MVPGAPLLPETDQATVSSASLSEAVNCMLWPVEMADFGGVREMAMGLAVPLTLMTWGESGALSVRVMVSERWPEAVGTKVTEMVQVPVAGSAAVQAFVVVKSLLLVPAAATDEMFREALPVFVTVTTIGVLVAPWVMAGKVMAFGETVTAGMLGVGAVLCTWPQPAARKRREKTQKQRTSFSNI